MITILAFLLSGITNRFIAFSLIFIAMTFDLGIKQTETKGRSTFLWRSIQIVAGLTGISHCG
ncbi:MAG: hypothetical protein AAF483_22855, partial [Planctomycetota bacterium]